MRYCSLALIVPFFFLGCGDPPNAPDSAGSAHTPAAETVESERARESATTANSATSPEPVVEFKPLSLSGGGADVAADASTNAGNPKEGSIGDVIDRLKPLQIMLGKWRGTTRREYEGFKAVDSHEWIWDLQSNPEQPALVLASDKSPYLKKASITFNVSKSLFLLTATDKEGTTRQYTGDFTDPVHEIVGPDDKMHRVFRLEFTQSEEPAAKGEMWQIAFAQQENNRYLLEVAKRRGKADFRRYDTVSTQRDGTSFAINDSDYGEKECIISQGLGTISVSYQGKSYWVCCSGCKAAFEEDPATWIARAEKRAKE